MHSHDATDIFLRPAFRGGYGWLFPRRATANLGVGVVYRQRDQLPMLLAQLQRELVDFGRIAPGAGEYLTGGLIPVGGRIRCSGRLGNVAVLLAGDAAGLTNPVTGAGIEAAVTSGECAGAAAANYLGGAEESLERFEDELADLFDPAQARALRRRRELEDAGERPSRSVYQRTWIAFPEYWRTDEARHDRSR
jgi:flavin-dependent dehydrogenase